MYVVLGDVRSSALPEGSIRKRKLAPEEARSCIQESQGVLTGCFEFGAVPSARRERNFRDLLTILSKQHGISLYPGIFFGQISSSDDTDDGKPGTASYPITPNLAQLSTQRPILVISYGFTFSDRPEDRTDSDIISQFRVSGDTLEFHLLECLE